MRSDYTNGEGYFSPTETEALRNAHALRTASPPTIVQRKRVQVWREGDGKPLPSEGERKLARKRMRQLTIVLHTIASMCGLEVTEKLRLRDKATGVEWNEEGERSEPSARNTAQRYEARSLRREAGQADEGEDA